MSANSSRRRGCRLDRPRRPAIPPSRRRSPPATGPAAAHREALDADFATLNEAAPAAETRSAEHVLAELEALRTELYVLQIAGGFDSARQIAFTAEQLAALPEPVAKEVAGAGDAAVRDHPGGCPRGARKAVGAAYPGGNNERGRDVMWCSATGDADRWPPPGSLVIADLAQQTRDEHLKLTLLDSGSTRWPPGPSARLLTLLESDLPWTISLTDRAGHSAQPAPAATRP